MHIRNHKIFSRMKNIRLPMSIIVYLLLLVAFMYGYATNFGYINKPIMCSEQYKNMNFDRASDPTIKEVYSARPWYKYKINDADISFQMKLYRIENLNNPFQTAPINKGIRMEVALPSTIALVIGRKTSSGFIAVNVTGSLEENRWYSVKLSIDRAKHIQVVLDNDIVASLDDGRIDYEISDIAIGSGFSKTRGFNGAIKDFSIEYEYERSFDETYLTIGLFVGLVVLFLILFFKEILLVAKRIGRIGPIYKDKDTFPEYNNDKIVVLLFSVPLACVIVYAAYYLYISIFYIPPSGISSVFLGFRYIGGQNDLPSEVFRQWKELSIVVPLLLMAIYFAFWIGIKKNVSFWKYLILIYFLGLFVEFLFLFLTTHGFSHVALQVKSINNGGFYSFGILFNHGFDIDRIRYIFQVLGANNSGYTIPGTTHPPGCFLMLAGIGFLGKFISSNSALGWGITVTLLNTLLIPIIATISKEAFSERIGKFTGIMLLTVPSVCIHFCSMFDVVLSVFTALGALFLIYGLKHIYDDQLEGKRKYSKELLFGLCCGTFFTVAAQGTYGHAIPILAFLLSFLFIVKKDEPKRIGILIAGIVIPAIIYFAFEYYISNGKAFWLVRAWNISSWAVVDMTAQSRPFPLAYFANFIVIFIIGGILFLPTILYIILSAIDIAVKTYKKKFVIYNKSHLIRKFLALSAFVMFLFLLGQTTVRLETERILHWFLAAVWPLMGIFFISANTVTERLFPLRKKVIDAWYAPLILCYIQVFITVILAMCIMDYY